MRSLFTPAALLALLLPGCGATVISGPDAASDAAVPGDTVAPVDGPQPCRFSSGRTCARGATCPDDDNCNVCACDLSGILACTARACVDAGPPGCRLANGTICAVNATCPAGDGCNSCRCGADGTLACTGLACIDAGPPGCVMSDGTVCPRGTACPSPDGCNTCACDTRGNLACTQRACVDAGVRPDSAICAGASIGRTGYDCAGPDDGTLPIECCTGWNCDVGSTICDRIPPTCQPGWVPSVVRSCYGPCVPRQNCAAR